MFLLSRYSCLALFMYLFGCLIILASALLEVEPQQPTWRQQFKRWRKRAVLRVRRRHDNTLDLAFTAVRDPAIQLLPSHFLIFKPKSWDRKGGSSDTLLCAAIRAEKGDMVKQLIETDRRFLKYPCLVKTITKLHNGIETEEHAWLLPERFANDHHPAVQWIDGSTNRVELLTSNEATVQGAPGISASGVSHLRNAVPAQPKVGCEIDYHDREHPFCKKMRAIAATNFSRKVSISSAPLDFDPALVCSPAVSFTPSIPMLQYAIKLGLPRYVHRFLDGNHPVNNFGPNGLTSWHMVAVENPNELNTMLIVTAEDAALGANSVVQDNYPTEEASITKIYEGMTAAQIVIVQIAQALRENEKRTIQQLTSRLLWLVYGGAMIPTEDLNPLQEFETTQTGEATRIIKSVKCLRDAMHYLKESGEPLSSRRAKRARSILQKLLDQFRVRSQSDNDRRIKIIEEKLEATLGAL